MDSGPTTTGTPLQDAGGIDSGGVVPLCDLPLPPQSIQYASSGDSTFRMQALFWFSLDALREASLALADAAAQAAIEVAYGDVTRECGVYSDIDGERWKQQRRRRKSAAAKGRDGATMVVAAPRPSAAGGCGRAGLKAGAAAAAATASDEDGEDDRPLASFAASSEPWVGWGGGGKRRSRSRRVGGSAPGRGSAGWGGIRTIPRQGSTNEGGGAAAVGEGSWERWEPQQEQEQQPAAKRPRESSEKASLLPAAPGLLPEERPLVPPPLAAALQSSGGSGGGGGGENGGAGTALPGATDGTGTGSGGGGGSRAVAEAIAEYLRPSSNRDGQARRFADGLAAHGGITTVSMLVEAAEALRDEPSGEAQAR